MLGRSRLPRFKASRTSSNWMTRRRHSGFFDLRQEFPAQWYRFLNPANPANGNVFELEMSPVLFRFLDSRKTLKINSISLLARCLDDGAFQVVATPPLAAP